MVETIRRYSGKLGDVTVERFAEDGNEEFRVKHSDDRISASWHASKRDAIAHAQFLAARY